MAADPLIGTQLGKYKIESRIGAGGMGVVYLALHAVIEDRRALKVLASPLAGQPAYRERFLKEAQLPASLNHPSILPIFDAGDEDGVLYIVMPYVRGADLEVLIKSSGPLDVDEAVTILGAVADALDEAHNNKLIHRDVKPSNVLVGELESTGRRVYLSDFGLVKAVDEATRASGTTPGMIVGTPPYIAPELWREEPLDGSVDQYALACTMFYALTGVPPYEATTMYAWMHAHTMGPIPSASALRSELPKDVDEPLARGLAKDPGDRFTSCVALVDAVGASVGSLPPAPTDTLESRLRPQTVLGIERVARVHSGEEETPPPPWWRRHVRAIGAAALAVAVVLVALLIVTLLPDGSGETGPTGPTKDVNLLEPAGQLDSPAILAAVNDADGSILVVVEGDPGVGADLVRLDPETFAQTKVADVPGTPIQMIVEEQATWVLTEEGPLYLFEGGDFDRLEIPLGGHPARMAPGQTAIWVTLPVQDRVKIVPRDDPTPPGSAPLEGSPHYISIPGSVVLVAGDEGQVSTLDIQTGDLLETRDLGGVPRNFTSAGGDGWAVSIDGKVDQVVVEGGLEVVPVADLGGQPLRIFGSGIHGDAVWIPDEEDGRLTRIDTRDTSQIDTARFPSPVKNLSTADPAVVIAVTSGGEVYRVAATTATILGEPERFEGTPDVLVSVEDGVVLFTTDRTIYEIGFEASQP